MAFRELMDGLKLPQGASPRYRRLEALGRMLTGELYDDLPYSFETETAGGRYIPLRDRRPSVDFCLAHEITQDTLSELFGDEQFPTISIMHGSEQDDAGTSALAELLDEVGMATAVSTAYEEGVVGSVGVVVHRSDNGLPYYDVLPGKWCEPKYRSPYSNQMIAFVVTYPIDRKAAQEKFPTIGDSDPAEAYWYRYVVGPVDIVDYVPLSDHRFSRLGEPDVHGEPIAFVEAERHPHGFDGRLPAIYTRNPGQPQRGTDGPALWWPIRNFCIEIDYTLSQCGRGLRYTADPMLFVRRGEFSFDQADVVHDGAAGGMATQTQDGKMVRGATQTLVGGPGSDAKLLEISAAGITEEREYVRDLREYALEVLGGMRARAEHVKGPSSGKAIDKGLKPLRRLVRRQRRPYGNGLLLDLTRLTVYGFRCGALDPYALESDFNVIKPGRIALEWPNDEALQGADLLQHVEGLQMAAGGSAANPRELVAPAVIGAKIVADIGLHEPYANVKGTAALPESRLLTP